MTSDEFRSLLFNLSPAERGQVADAFGVTTRTVQRWSTSAGQRRDATRAHPDIARLSYDEALIGLRGAAADISRPANKGSGEIPDYVFTTFADAARFAYRVRHGRTDNTFINNAVTEVRVIQFGGDYAVVMFYDASYSAAEGWADRDWDDPDYNDNDEPQDDDSEYY